MVPFADGFVLPWGSSGHPASDPDTPLRPTTGPVLGELQVTIVPHRLLLDG